MNVGIRLIVAEKERFFNKTTTYLTYRTYLTYYTLPSMRRLGIDPGLATIGIGLVEMDQQRKLRALDWLTITTPAGLPLGKRLQELSKDLRTYIRESNVDLAVVERLFFATNRQTAIDVAQARGAILLTIEEHAVPVLEPTPLQLKMAIAGDGAADKRQVQDMVMRTLLLDRLPSPDDAADALALALYGAFTHNMHSIVAQ